MSATRTSVEKDRDPVTTPALPRAGEALDRKIRRDFEWEAFYYTGVAIGLIVFTAMAWIVELIWGHGLRMLTIGSIVVGVGTAIWIRRKHRELQTLKLGHRGEVAVGEALEGLRERGYRVFHDVASEGRGNIDHVVIGPSGIYVIETKTRTLPREGRAVIETDGQRVRVGEHAPWDDRPIRQVCAVRTRVRDWLKAEGMSEWNVPVRAVLMFPGPWWIDGSSGREVWVLKPDALAKWIAREERDPKPLATDRLQMLIARFENHTRRLADQDRAR